MLLKVVSCCWLNVEWKLSLAELPGYATNSEAEHINLATVVIYLL